MDLHLTDNEADELRGLLEHYLPELRREVARTDKLELRRELAERLSLVEKLLHQLPVPVA